MADWKNNINFAFIDGCHGKNCGIGDFLAIEKHIKTGSIVCFHDSNELAQGKHLQPHCQTGIAIREAIIELGLLSEERPNWRKLADVDGIGENHGCAIFQYI